MNPGLELDEAQAIEKSHSIRKFTIRIFGGMSLIWKDIFKK